MSSALNIIDPELALERAGGNPELARELFQMLQNELPDYQSRINQSFEDNDDTRLLEIVHKLNGSSTYCGVPALKEAASSLESLLKRGEKTGYEAGVNAVLAEIRRLQQAPELAL